MKAMNGAQVLIRVRVKVTNLSHTFPSPLPISWPLFNGRDINRTYKYRRIYKGRHINQLTEAIFQDTYYDGQDIHGSNSTLQNDNINNNH